MESLLDLIRTKTAALMQAEATAIALRRELLDAKEELLKMGIGALPGMVPTVATRVAGNSTEWAADVVRKAGTSLHVNDIISGIEREYGQSVRYATLVGNISRLVKKEKIFERTGPNRFGLLEWHSSREADELFGREIREADRIEH